MSSAELAETFLFRTLTREQLGRIEQSGTTVELPAGTVVFSEGEPADHLWVLLEGRVRICRRINHEEAVVAVMDRPGAWAGGLRAYGAGATGAMYMGSGRTDEPSRLFRLPSAELGALLTDWWPLSKHLLDGMFQTVRGIDAMARQQSSLAALGTLAAGLAHELNNPSAAAAQAAGELGSRVSGVVDGLLALGAAGVTPGELEALLLEGQVGSAGPTGRGDPLELADTEARLATRLGSLRVADPATLAGTLTSAGLDDRVVARLEATGVGDIELALTAVANLSLVRKLVGDIANATSRVADLVAAVRGYSQLDRAPVQEVDVEAGLESTLTVLAHRLRGVTVLREYSADLPDIPGHPGELNQVWTNLIHNASDAVAGAGVIRIRTTAEVDRVVVEIADDGPGIAATVLDRIFEPFFTTKEVGAGTGLGLDISRRIVVDRHHGTIEARSGDDGTVFRVTLPRATADATVPAPT